jgi:hypothetical protein
VYYFDPLTFAENSHDRRMRYYPRDPSPFWVEAVIRKADRHIETRKYRGEELICHAAGPDFQKAMIHTTMVGLTEGEPAFMTCSDDPESDAHKEQ